MTSPRQASASVPLVRRRSVQSLAAASLGALVVAVGLRLALEPRLSRSFADELLRLSPGPEPKEVYIVELGATTEALPGGPKAALLDWLERAAPKTVGLDFLIPSSRADDAWKAALQRPGLVSLMEVSGLGPSASSVVGAFAVQGAPLDRDVVLPELSSLAGHGFGRGAHGASWPDEDGILRRHAVAARVGSSWVPSLALALWLAHHEIPYERLGFERGRLRVESERARLDLPLDRDGFLVIDPVRDWSAAFRAPLGDMPTSAPNDPIFLVGRTDAFTGDVVATAVEPRRPGVLVWGDVLTALLENRAFRVAHDAWGWLLLLAGVLAIGLGSASAPTAVLALVPLLGFFVPFVAQAIGQLAFMTLLPVAWVGPSLLFASVASLLVRVHVESRARAIDRGHIDRYLVPALVESLSTERVPPPSRLDLSMLFVDIAGFTPFTASREPEEVSDLLGRFHGSAFDALAQHGGQPYQFLGDGMVAWFRKDQAKAAVAAAWDILARFEEAERDRLRKSGGAALSARAGIASGMATVRCFGDERRAVFAIIGDVVNRSARLQQLAEPGGLAVDTPTAARAELPGEPERIAVKGLGELDVIRPTKP